MKPRTVKVLMLTVTEPLADLLFTLSNVVLVIGAAAVLIGTIGAIAMGGAKERFADQRISDNEVKAAKANARANEAALELAKYKAPRTSLLTPEKIQTLVSSLSAFKGQSVSISAVPQTWESLTLAHLLLRIFSAAHMRANFNQAFGSSWVGIRRGISAMYITGSADGQRFAETFAREMTDLGIPTSAQGGLMQTTKAEMLDRVPSIKPTDPYLTSVVVVIGEKPQ